MASSVDHKLYTKAVPYTYFGNGISSGSVGIDGNDSGKLKLSALSIPEVNPTTVAQLTIDPSTNGNIVLKPNGSGKVTIDYATQYYMPVYGANGALSQLAGLGSSGYVLTSNGAGASPTFQAAAAPAGTAYYVAAYNVSGNLSQLASIGTSGQVLTSLGAGLLPIWEGIPAPTGTAYKVAAYSSGGSLTELASLGTSGQILTSNGAGFLPTFQTAASQSGTQYHVAVFDTSNNITQVAALGTSGQVLTSGGAGVNPSWVNPLSGGYKWNLITSTPQTLVAGNGYITNTTPCVYTLPSSNTLGDSIIVTCAGSSTQWKIVVPSAGDYIIFAGSLTTATTGYLQSTGDGDVVELVYIDHPEGNRWIVIRSIGNITVV